ncbi:MAG: aspartate aminotransferase family protein [Nitrospinae bacterium CG11_big_fil_rev_8_21_14_0_20_56_8]|nr:MAG: aspartate aminotransferase family protein [Nitrospinae bacterium CG11_big_fil_rev_8_21_14_0_20_56_8]
MKRNQDIVKLTEKHIASTYGRYPIALVRGKGTQLWDRSGKQYTDFVSGLAVDNLGHCHAAVVEAIRKQAGLLLHVSNLYHIQPQAELAADLAEVCFADKFFFCNSGTEANEAAIKLVRKYFHDRGKKQHEIITMDYSFHGRTLGSLSATAQKKFHTGFAPLLNGFKYVPFDNPQAVEKAVSAKTCAVLVEPVQGEGGVNLAAPDYFIKLKKICQAHKILLVFDEVQTGFGRTGTLFAYEQVGVTPDLITLAKALGGGVAIGALGGTREVMDTFVPGTHAATFGGNPLACAAARASLQVLTRKGFLEKSVRTGQYFLERLIEVAAQFPMVRQVRGMGLMLAMELNQSGSGVVFDCMRQGYLINCIQDRILRFIPPLIVTKKEIDGLIEAMKVSLGKLKS